MSYSLTAFQAQLNALLASDENEMKEIDRERMVKMAVERYSHDRPEIITEDVTGDGGKYYATSGLGSWIDGQSQITAIQYPAYAVSADEIPQYLAPSDWDDNYRDASDVQYIFLPNHAPASAETFRVTYTTTYQLTSEAYNIPPSDFFAVCQLSAYFACLALATKYARTNESSINADSVDHGGRSGRFLEAARTFERAYLEHMDMSGPGEPSKELPAAEFVAWDIMPSQSRRYLFRGRR